MDIRFLGHAAFELTHGDTSVLVDPFLTGNPKAAVSADDVNPTTILLTHGHADHLGDTVAIAKRAGAPVVAIVELANEIGGEGVDVFDPNYGGAGGVDWGWGGPLPARDPAPSPHRTPPQPARPGLHFGGQNRFHPGGTPPFFPPGPV